MRKYAPLLALLPLVLAAAWLSRTDHAGTEAAPRDAAAFPGERPPGEQYVRGRRGAPADAEAVPETTAAPVELSPWTVVVLGPGERPQAGVRMSTHRDGSWQYAVSDDRGTVTFPRRADEPTLAIVIGGPVPEDDVTLTDPRTELRYPTQLPLRVTVVDAETGAVLRPERVAIEHHAGDPLPLLPDGDGYRVETSSLRPGLSEPLSLRVDPPPGYVGATHVLDERISAFAEEIHVTVPLQPELRLVLDVRHADGTAAGGARVDAVYVHGRFREFDIDREGDGNGRYELRGAPFARNAKVELGVYAGEHWTEASLTLGADPDAAHHLRVDLPAEETGVPCEEFFCGHVACITEYLRDPDGDALVDLVARRANGLPAAFATVRAAGVDGDEHTWEVVARADADGRAQLGRLSAGPVFVHVLEPGFVHEPRALTIGAGTVQQLEIREQPSTPLRVRVVDAAGRPVPAAAVRVSSDGSPYGADSVDRVQHLPSRTDADGRLTLRVPADGRLRVRAEWDACHGSVDTDRRGPLTIRVAAPGE